MINRKIYKIITLACVFSLLSTTLFTPTPVNATENNIQYEKRIDDLFSQMLHNNVLKASKSKSKNYGIYSNSTPNVDNLNSDIEAELKELGVVKLTSKEVTRHFNMPSTQNIEIEKPYDDNDVQWYKQRTATRRINGKEYEVGILRAVPDGYKSPLIKARSTITYTTRDSFQVGKKNFIKFVIKKGVRKWFGEVLRDNLFQVQL